MVHAAELCLTQINSENQERSVEMFDDVLENKSDLCIKIKQ